MCSENQKLSTAVSIFCVHFVTVVVVVVVVVVGEAYTFSFTV